MLAFSGVALHQLFRFSALNPNYQSFLTAADDRLDQLKPLLSEALTVLDRHTYQLKQLNVAVSQLFTAVSQQGDNISFLLRGQLSMKGDIAAIKTQQNQMDAKLGQVDGKLDQILQLIQKPGQ